MKKLMALLLFAIVLIGIVSAIDYNSNNNGQTLTTSESPTSAGLTVRTGAIVTIKNDSISNFVIEKGALDTGDTCLIMDMADNVIASANFSGVNCTISTPSPLVAGTEYQFLETGTQTWAAFRSSGTTFPIQTNTIDWNGSQEFYSGTDHPRTDVMLSIQDIWTGQAAGSISTTLNSPLNNSLLLKGSNTIFSATVTPSGFNFTNATLYIWFANGTLFDNSNTNTSINSLNVTAFTKSINLLGNFAWNVFGVMGNGVSTNSSFATANNTFATTNTLFYGQQAASTIITNSEQTISIKASITPEFSIANAVLVYNNTNYTTSFSSINSTDYIISSRFNTPNTSVLSIVPFNFMISLNDSSVFNSTLTNQTINTFSIDNCAINTVQIMNLSMFDEDFQTIINPTLQNTSIKLNLLFYSNPTLTTLANQFSTFYNKTNPALVCMNNTIGNSTFYENAQIQYEANGYATKYYNIQNYSFNSTLGSSQNITLYNLNSTENQPYSIIIKDSSFLPLQGALVQIWRYYVAEGKFKIVEIPMTDANGQTIGNLVSNNVIYNFIIIKNGQIISTFNNVRAVCQTPLVSSCVIDFNSFSSGISNPSYTTQGNLNFTLGYNSTSRVLSSNFVVLDGTVHVISLNVTTEDALGTKVCENQITSASGLLSCVVPSTFGNATVIAKIYMDGNLIGQGTVKLGQFPVDIYGGGVVIIALFALLTIIGVAISDNPIFTIIMFFLGIIFLMALNIIANTGFIATTVLYMIAIVVILLIKGAKRN